MTRTLLIAARPALEASLAEQFATLGGYELRSLSTMTFPSPPWPHFVILDEDFCNPSALARQLRAAAFSGPILVIGSPSPGADANLGRPFRFAQLLDRIESLSPAQADETGAARLTEKEAAILERLAEARGATLSKEALLSAIWGYGPTVATRTLETHIHRLRRKIEADPLHPRKLLTAAGGYRLALIVDDAENGASPQKSGSATAL